MDSFWRRGGTMRAGAAASIVVLALVGAGCGGGDTGGSSSKSTAETAEPADRAAFIAQADQACSNGGKEFKEKLSAYLQKNKIKELGSPSEPKAETESHVIAIVETVGIPVLRKQVETIKALKAPSEVSAEAEKFVKATEEAIEAGEQSPLKLYSEQAKLFAKSDQIAQQIGFKACGAR